MKTVTLEVTPQAAQVIMDLIGSVPTKQGLYPLYEELAHQLNEQLTVQQSPVTE